MPSKIFEVDGIGPVTITKRRSSKHIRLSINAKQQVKLSLPTYIPYAAGVKFVTSKRDWIAKQLSQRPVSIFSDGARIGKSFRLRLEDTDSGRSRVTLKGNEIVIHTGDVSADIQAKVEKACERALRQDAGNLLPQRLADLAVKYGYEYKSVGIKKMTSRWGSCSSDKHITLSIYLIQLPWHLIDYVLLHELNHTVHLNHQKGFWDEMRAKMRDTKERRAELKKYRPVILPQ
jgi:predicted metal-dependent hydrolase